MKTEFIDLKTQNIIKRVECPLTPEAETIVWDGPDMYKVKYTSIDLSGNTISVLIKKMQS